MAAAPMKNCNGCICCTLRDDLLIEVARLAREGRFDYLLIEASGVSEPLPIAETFTFPVSDTDGGLSEITHLDTMVTVVDAHNVMREFASLDTMAERGIGVTPRRRAHDCRSNRVRGRDHPQQDRSRHAGTASPQRLPAYVFAN